MSQICTSCKYTNLDVALYCANCGTKFIVERKEITRDETLMNIIFIVILLIIGFKMFNQSEKERIKISSYDYSNSSYSSVETTPPKISSIEIEKYYTLEVRTIPSDSKIEILNICEPYQKDIKLKKGKYTIRVSHNGYKTFTKKILLEHNAYITAKLEKIDKDNIWECNIEWIINKGEKFKPTNKNLQTLSIELINGADKLHLKTQNGESIYNYESFIDLKDNNLGMNYIYGNRFIGIFQNKTLFLGSNKNGIDAKYYCKDMVLDITKSTSSKTQKDIKSISSHQDIKKIVTPIKKFSLSVQTTPSNARVRILNIKPKYYNGIKLKKGKYHIEVSQIGYKTINRWILLKKDTSLHIKLNKIQIHNTTEIIDYREPVTTSHIKNRMGEKERENLKTCMNGSYVSLCKHSWLTPQQAQDVRQAERRENLKTCMNGSYVSLCKHSWLTPQQAQDVRQAERRENLKTCMNGSYVSLCKHSWLTPQQAQDVKRAERRENLKTCMNGSYVSLCKHSWLTPQQSQDVRQAERRENLKTCMNGSYVSLCEHSWLTPQQAQDVKRAERRAGN